jgi:uncharacterized protein (TIGR00296 family)
LRRLGKFLTAIEKQRAPESNLTLEEGKTLVSLARLAISKYLESNEIIKPPRDIPEKLLRKSGVFVTLNTLEPKHELRGCIGYPYPSEPLAKATIQAAISAATEDSRFKPVDLRELKSSIVLELTHLTEPRNLDVSDRRTLPKQILIGKHGLIVAAKGTSGLLLPQVATEWNWDSSEFLMNCCLKAGLRPDSWLLDGVEVKVFEGEIFEEVKPEGDVRRKSTGGI